MKATSSARQRRRLAAAGLLVVLVCICSALLADDAADVAPLIQDLKGANADARLKALEKLVEMGPKAAPAVQALIGVLDDPVEIHRDYAITTLKHIGPAAAPALAKLREAAAKDKSQDIRSLAQDAAEQIAASGGTATEEPPGSTFTPAPSNDDGAPRAPDVIPPAPPATPEQPGGSDPLAGSYRGDKLALVLVSRPQAPGQYSGTVALGEQQFPLSAHLDGQQILGTFQSGGKEFAFTLTVEGAKARFQTGRTTYSLAREQASIADANPLETGQKGQPAPVAPPIVPASFIVISQSAAGCALSCELPGVRSAQTALRSAAKAIAGSFDAKPTVTGAYCDQQDCRGGATFRAKRGGQAVRGVIIAGSGERGATVSVVYAAENADPRTLSLLAAALPAPTPPVRWQMAKIADGSGQVKIPDTWRIVSGQKGMCTVVGPEGQQINLGIATVAVTPELAAYRRQMTAKMGLPAADMLVARPDDPARAWADLLPQLSAMGEKVGQPPFKLVKIVGSCQVPALQNWRSALVDYLLDVRLADRAVRCHGAAMIICADFGGGQWGLHFSQMCAPVAIFERDLPTMIEIWSGWTVSDVEVHRRLGEAAASMKATGEILRRAREERSAHEAARAQRQDTNADFDEAIRGWRTVEDTLTGEKKQVSLGDVDIIVQGLNEHEGWARFKGIPLREDW